LLECNVDYGGVQKRPLYTAEATSAPKKCKISGGDASLARDTIELEIRRKRRERARGRLKALDRSGSAAGIESAGGLVRISCPSRWARERDGNVLLDFSCPCMCRSNITTLLIKLWGKTFH
jgi:hypothetical protein